MKSELEKLAAEIARHRSDFYEGIFFGAKLVLNHARAMGAREYGTNEMIIDIAELETFIGGDKND